ncbi:Golgin subfamily A member 7/ERF4 family-domain-containing protein [Xylaria intraflava]|nr:Golgin subfamily A member 7/ERF4 family-domain-containing protein [Xylaria intraflava]
MPAREWMNSANPFAQSPLNANIVDARCNPSSRNGNKNPAREKHRTTRKRSETSSLSRRGGNTSVFPTTASHATGRSTKLASSAVEDSPVNPDVAVSESQQLEQPADSSQRNDDGAARPTRSPRHTTHQSPPGLIPADSNRHYPVLPFRSLAANSSPENRLPLVIGPPGRLWNPVNSTPRLPPVVYTRRRRPSTPLPPSIPINHPTLDDTGIRGDQIATGAGDYPLLTLPEQRQSRHPTPTRSSFQLEGRVHGGKRISLPSSVRHSFDIKQAIDAPPEPDTRPGPSQHKPRDSLVSSLRKRGQSVTEKGRPRAVSFGLVQIQPIDRGGLGIDKGKAVMSQLNDETSARGFSTDLERGTNALGQHHNRSNVSLPGGIGSIISSSNSSIIGDPDQPGLGDEWGPQHPCFPHLNPYVPINSTEYRTTRIIRVRRDWLVAGDLAPTFSNMYPEILDPAGVSEQEFRRVIEKLNRSLIPIFNPYHWRNIFDGLLGVLSGWIWEDFGLTNVKMKLRELETWIEKWNAEMEKTTGSEDGAAAPKIISLRRTGYMSLDFQIPNPEVSVSVSEPASRSGPAPAEVIASAVS